MPDPDRGTKKVSQSAIDEIKKLGMTQAIRKYHSGNTSPEFRTAVERYYSPQRLKGGSIAPKPQDTPSAPKTETKTETKPPVTMPASAPAAASRRTKTTAEKALGRRNVESAKKVTQPIANIASNLAGSRSGNLEGVSKSLRGAGKKLGINNPFKPRKRK
jgi:hypothetical protein